MGKKGSDLSKYQRQEMVLNFLERFGRHDGLTTRQVFELLENALVSTTIRTTQRDLEELSLYHPISEDQVKSERRWIWVASHQEEREMTDLRYRHLRDFMDYFERNRSASA